MDFTIVMFCNVFGIVLVHSLNVEECPEFDGSEEFRQYIRFNEIYLGVTGQGLSPVDVLAGVANEYLDNIRWIAPNLPYEHIVRHNLLK